MKGFFPLSVVALVLLIAGFAFAQTSTTQAYFQAKNELGTIMYQGPDQYRAFQSCSFYTVRDQNRACTWVHVSETGRRDTLKVVNASKTGIWTWVAPTKLENGNILTDLSYYLIYRQPTGGVATPWAQVTAEVSRAVIPMGPEFYGACFWMVAVRKPTASPPVASDKSNSICLDAQGQPIAAT